MKNENPFEKFVKLNSSTLSLQEAHLVRSAFIATLIRWDHGNLNFTRERVNQYSAALHQALLILKPDDDR